MLSGLFARVPASPSSPSPRSRSGSGPRPQSSRSWILYGVHASDVRIFAVGAALMAAVSFAAAYPTGREDRSSGISPERINDLKLGKTRGKIALWIGLDTEGYFSNLVVK